MERWVRTAEMLTWKAIIIFLALPTEIDPLAPKRAILRWCWVLVDRWVCSHIPRSRFSLTDMCRMKDHAAAVVTDEAFATRAERFPADTPDTKEAYYIREIFEGEKPSHLTFGLLRLTYHFSGYFPSDAAAKTAVR
jgi:hypothetical protein